MPELNSSPDESPRTDGTPAAPEATDAVEASGESAPAAKKATRKRAPRKTAAKKTTAPATEIESDAADAAPATPEVPVEAATADTTEAPAAAPRRRTRKAAASAPKAAVASPEPSESTIPASTDDTAPAANAATADVAAPLGDTAETEAPAPKRRGGRPAKPAVLFQAPDFEAAPLFVSPEPPPVRTEDSRRARAAIVDELAELEPATDTPATGATEESAPAAADDADNDTDENDESGPRRRRRRGGRGRRKKGDEPGSDAGDDSDSDTDNVSEAAAPSGAKADDSEQTDDSDSDGDLDADDAGDGESTSRRRRRRRRRKSGEGEDTDEDAPGTVARVRDGREVEDEVTSLKGSTRLEAKKQRRREGREAGRRRPPILSEAEFLARRESVDRVMAVRQSGDLTQIAVLEDDVLVEHYVSQAAQQSLIGNVYLGRVQNVLPAMEAAFVDIGRGRNAVIYAGEVDWSGRKSDGPRRIEDVLKSGQSILVQITKDPIGHKGARLTSQISLPGRYVVYVPGGSMSGISRKLPDNERTRLKNILKKVVPDDAGVIVRTAAEGASEEELTNDVTRLQNQWTAIQAKVDGQGPALLHGEPDLAIKVVRDLFNEDFNKLIVSGDKAWDAIEDYVTNVASSLAERVQKWTGPSDLFADKRIDEQIAKALDRKVWLPSGGSLVIDRTEAMTVVDVNTGKFTGSGGNLEETVTKNNLEAAEEVVRQLRLRDIGGIIVIDFIDMVLEANRDLVLRRLVECLGRDRTKHQVAEVTSLGLVQMTRKRIGTGLVEAFSEPCQHCKGRGVVVHMHPVDSGSKSASTDDSAGSGSRKSGRGRRRRDEDHVKAPEPLHGPKLDAAAVSSHASPADLFAGAVPAHDENTTNGTPAEALPDPVDETPAEDDSATPKRGRRRARRSAGRPEGPSGELESSTNTSGETSSDSVEYGAPVASSAPAPAPAPAEAAVPSGEDVAVAPATNGVAGVASVLAEVPAATVRRGRRRAERPAGRPETDGDVAATAGAATPIVAPAGAAPEAVTGIPVTTVGTAVVETVTRRPRRRVERPAGKPEPHADEATSEPATTT